MRPTVSWENKIYERFLSLLIIVYNTGVISEINKTFVISGHFTVALVSSFVIDLGRDVFRGSVSV